MMRLHTRATSTLRSLFRKEALDRDLDDELRSYLDQVADEKIGSGMTRSAAYRQARIELGGVEQVKEKVRARRLGAHVDVLTQDIRYAARSLRRNAGFSVVAIAILAIGIGATTALFSNVHSVLVRGVGYAEADRLVVLQKAFEDRLAGSISRLDYYDFRDSSDRLQDIAALTRFSDGSVFTGGSKPERVRMGFATWNLFSVLGVQPIAGRGFLLSDEEIGGSTAVLITEGLSRRRFGNPTDAVGATLMVNGTSYEVAGVLPASFHFLSDAEVWRLIDRDGPFDQLRDQHSLLGIGRLSPGVTVEQAQLELDAVAAGLAETYRETNKNKGVHLTPLNDYMVRDVRLGLVLLMATTSLVLLLACGNVAGLFLARGESRATEMAMRTALGAPRGRLVRQLLTESLVLTSIAGLIGIVVARLLHDMLLRLIPIGELGIARPAIDGWTLGFAVIMSVVTGLLVGLVPALRSTERRPAADLRSGTRTSAGRRNTRLRSGLVVIQVAGSVALLVASGLMIRSLANLSSADLGFETENLLTGNVQILPAEYETREQTVLFFTSVIDEVKKLPGVESAALINKLPIISPWMDWAIWPAETQPELANDKQYAMARYVTPDYFETMGIRILAGRDISSSDRIGTEDVVVISSSTAAELFGDANPVGRTVGIGWSERSFRVVGVVGDAKLNMVRYEPDPAMYMALAQNGNLGASIAVRTVGDPEALAAQIEDIVVQHDSNALFADAESMENLLAADLAGFRTIILSLALFAGVALALTAIGLYGTLAYHVGTRRKEFGIRRAMGATDSRVLGMVLGHGLSLVAIGLAVGLAASYPGTLLIQQLLFETTAIDPTSYAGAVGFLALVAVVACLVPALHATRSDIAEVLRTD